MFTNINSNIKTIIKNLDSFKSRYEKLSIDQSKSIDNLLEKLNRFKNQEYNNFDSKLDLLYDLYELRIVNDTIAEETVNKNNKWKTYVQSIVGIRLCLQKELMDEDIDKVNERDLLRIIKIINNENYNKYLLCDKFSLNFTTEYLASQGFEIEIINDISLLIALV